MRMVPFAVVILTSFFFLPSPPLPPLRLRPSARGRGGGGRVLGAINVLPISILSMNIPMGAYELLFRMRALPRTPAPAPWEWGRAQLVGKGYGKGA